MKTERLILKNTVFLTSGKIIGDLCAFTFVVSFARVFGKEVLGQYAFAMSVGGLSAMLIGLGLNTLLELEVSRDKSQNSKYLGNLLIAQGVFAGIVWSFIVAFALISGFSHEMKVILIILGGYHVFYRFTMVFRAEFRAHEEIQYSAFIESLHKFIILVLGGLSMILWKNVVVTLCVYPISAFCMFSLGFIISVKRYGLPDWHIDYGFIRHAVQTSWPFFWILLVAQVYLRSGVILLTYLEGESAAGSYAAPDRLILAIASGLALFGGAIMPSMSRLSDESKAAFLKLYERLIRLMFVLLMPCSTLLFIMSKPIILVGFGEQFSESVKVLQVLCWILLFVGLNYVMSAFLFVSGHQKKWSTVQIGVCVGFVLISLVSIPQFGFMGLAYTRLLAEAIMIWVAHRYITKHVYHLHIIKLASAPILCCAATLFVFYLMSSVSLWLSVPIALAVCLLTMILFGGVRMQDIEYAKKLIYGHKGAGQKKKSGSVDLDGSVL